MRWQSMEFDNGQLVRVQQGEFPIMEYCNYCRKETETKGLPGGDCKICGFSKPTPEHLREKKYVEESRAK